MSATLATAASGRELIPGDPDEVEALAARLAALGEGLSEAAARLVDLDDGGWRGPAAEAFRATLGDQPQRYAVAGEAFADATAALRRYAGVVSDAQAEAQRALQWWQEAEAATAGWERAWAVHDAEAARLASSTDPAVAAGTLDLVAPGLVDPGAEWRQRALSTLDAASAAVDHEAAATASALAAAEQGAPDEPSFWSRLWAGLSGFAGGLWASTGGAVVEIVDAVLDDPGGFVTDAWDNAVDHLNVFDWDTFADTWAETGKDLVAWDDWAAGNPARALGRIAGNVLMGLGTGKVALRLLRGRKHQGSGRASRDVRTAIQRTPEDNRRLIQRFDDAPGYQEIFRDARSDRHILTGEDHGKGGHRARTGRPGKTEFPEGWSDARILDAVDTAAQNPVREWRRKDFPNGNTNFSYVGHADGLRITVVVGRDARVISAYPEKGQRGVYHNPRKPKPPPVPAGRCGPGRTARPGWTATGPGRALAGSRCTPMSADNPSASVMTATPCRHRCRRCPFPRSCPTAASAERSW